MSGGDYLVAAILTLEAGASLTFLLYNHDWKQAIVWGGVAISNAAYLAMTRTP